jgi:hypothetical protein
MRGARVLARGQNLLAKAARQLHTLLQRNPGVGLQLLGGRGLRSSW